jgi:hypothetical protein
MELAYQRRQRDVDDRRVEVDRERGEEESDQNQRFALGPARRIGAPAVVRLSAAPYYSNDSIVTIL